MIKLGFPKREIFTSNSFVILLVTIGIFIGFRIWHITFFSLWTDEIFTQTVARLPWTAMFWELVSDKVHPPLFYVLIKLWITVGGQSLLWLKLFPVLISVLTIIPYFLLCRRLNLSSFVINLVLALMAANGFLVHFAQELRMYSLLMLFGTISCYFFVRFVNQEDSSAKNLFLLFIGNLLLVYTHYFGLFIVGTEGIFLFWLNRQLFWTFSKSAAVLAICFVPWAYLIVHAIVTNYGPTYQLDWIGRPGFYEIVKLFLVFTSPTYPTYFSKALFAQAIIFGIPILIFLRQIFEKRKFARQMQQNLCWWLLTSCILPVILIFVISLCGSKSIWNERYLIIIVLPFFLMIGIALDKLQTQWLRTFFLALMIAWTIFNGMKGINETDDLFRIPWQSIIQEMISQESSDAEAVKVYTFESHIKTPIRFYLKEFGEKRFDTVMIDSISDVKGTHSWVVFREKEEKKKQLSTPQFLLQEGYQIDKEFEFGNAGSLIYLISIHRN